MSAEKLTTLEDAAALVRDGDTVAIQNMATQAAPMALVRELIRQGRRDLGVVCLVGGISVDWLAAAGAMNRLIGAAVSMEQFGLCQRYRKAVEAGAIRVEELSETALVADLERRGVAASHVPRVPEIVTYVAGAAQPGDRVVIMSNGGFGGIHERLLSALAAAPEES